MLRLTRPLLIHAHQAHFQAVRTAELVAAQRLEAAERRKMEERDRRLRQVCTWVLVDGSWGGGALMTVALVTSDRVHSVLLSPRFNSDQHNQSALLILTTPLQEGERRERERVVRAKVAASAFARGYLNGIIGNVFQNLQDTGEEGFERADDMRVRQGLLAESMHLHEPGPAPTTTTTSTSTSTTTTIRLLC